MGSGTDTVGSVETRDFLRPAARATAPIAWPGQPATDRSVRPDRASALPWKGGARGACAGRPVGRRAGFGRFAARTGGEPRARPPPLERAEEATRDRMPKPEARPPPTSGKGRAPRPARPSRPKRPWPSSATADAGSPGGARGRSSAPRFYHGGRTSLRRHPASMGRAIRRTLPRPIRRVAIPRPAPVSGARGRDRAR